VIVPVLLERVVFQLESVFISRYPKIQPFTFSVAVAPASFDKSRIPALILAPKSAPERDISQLESDPMAPAAAL
jgi:hypothetical protein